MFQSFLIKLLIIALTMALAIMSSGCSEKKTTLTVAAGTGLMDALTEVHDLFNKRYDNILIASSFASAGDLQKQIENGAPVDIFFSAATMQMDALEEQDLILRDTRKNILTNKLVLITPKDNPSPLSRFEDLTGHEVKLIAIGDPDFVPAGNYALTVFELFDIPIEALKPKIILGNNVRQVLFYVENNNVDYGIVYYTDTINSEKVRVVATAPDEINNKIIFPAAVVASSTNVEAAITYIEFLFGAEAEQVFMKYGFTVVGN